MLKQKLEFILKLLIYSTFFVPLLVLPSSFIFPFIVPKVIVFRTIVELMLFVYLILLYINYEQYKPRFNYINLGVSLFVFSFAISTFVGVDVYHSFWDNHERMLGLFTLVHYFIFFLICPTVFREWKDWKLANRVFLFAGFLVMFIAWLQTQNPNLLLNNGADRVSSTLGNSIYLGGYGMFLLFLAVLSFLREKNVLWQVFYGVVGLFGFMGIFWSGTRGDLLGLAVAAILSLIYYIIVLKNYPKARFGLLGLAVVGIVVVSMLYSFRKTDFVAHIPAVGRAMNTSFDDVKNSARWIAWEISIQSWKEKPIFGWGPNNFFYAFNAHYNPKSLDFGFGETWFDNAHNILVNTLAVQGLVGLVTYLGMFGLVVVELVKILRKQFVNYHLVIVGISFLVAHFVSNITVFENPTSYLYFMFWLALFVSMSNGWLVDNSHMKSDKKISMGTLSMFGLVFFLIIFIFNIQPARANMKALGAVRAISQNPIIGIPQANEALAFSSPHIDDIRSDIARTIVQILSGGWQKIGKEKSDELFNIVVVSLEKNLLLHPLDIRNQLALAQIYQMGSMIDNNGLYVIKSEVVLEDALKKSPKRQQIIYSLATTKMQLNKMTEAAKLLEQTIEDNPKIDEGYWRLAYIYKINNQIDKAKEILKTANDRGVVFQSQGQQMIDNFILVSSSVPGVKKK